MMGCRSKGWAMIRETYYSVKNKVVPAGDRVFDISRFRKKKGDISPLAPSRELLDDWNQDRLRWKDYVERYYQELKERGEANKLIGEITDLAAKDDVWLVCMEKEYPCHRFLVIHIIEKILVARGALKYPQDQSELFRFYKDLTRSQIKALRASEKASKRAGRRKNPQPLVAIAQLETTGEEGG